MEKIGEYLPLIIIVVSFIYSIVKKTSKIEREKTENTTLPGNSPQQTRTTSVANPILKKSTRIEKKEQRKEIVQKEQTQERLVSSVTEVDEFPETVEDSLLSDLSGNRDELKKAIIYSEIFNRKF